jgi:subtilisin family serine protease
MGGLLVAAPPKDAQALSPTNQFKLITSPTVPLAAMTAQASPATTADYVNDPYAASYQWYLDKIGAYAAWKPVGGANAKVTVGVIDTGVRLTQVDLTGRIDTAHAYDIVKGGQLSTATGAGVMNASGQRVNGNGDVNGHGTHVSGIIAATQNNARLGAGIGKDVSVLPVEIFGAGSAGGVFASPADLVAALDYLIGLKESGYSALKVINLSLSCYSFTEATDAALRAAIARATADGILVVAAAGNDDTSAPSYPAAYPDVLSVAATDINDNRAYYSNYGSTIDICAPGGGATSAMDYIFSTGFSSNDDFVGMFGTSMASPMVAAAAADVWSYNPALTVAQVRNLLTSTAVDLGSAGRDDYYGAGRLSIERLMSKLGAYKQAVEPAKPTLKGAKLSVAARTYNGRAQKPAPKVVLTKKTLKAGRDYTVSYKNNVKVGKATITVKPKGAYAGSSRTVSFRINPAKKGFKSVKASKRKLTLAWSKAGKAQAVNRYQVRYKRAGVKSWVYKQYSAKIAKAALTKLKKGKRYHVQFRVRSKVGATYYYSAWSADHLSAKVR